LDQLKRRLLVCMEVDGEVTQQGVSGLLQSVEIVPPAMVGQLGLEIAPEALDEVAVWRVGRQKGGLETLVLAVPHGRARLVW
jgi:hypothetical protein